MSHAPDPDIDQATADLIIKLQLEDACLYFETSKGTSREPTDEEIAFRMQQENLQNAPNLAEDRRMALSFYFAAQTDAQAIADSETEEKVAARDRELARNWRDDSQPVTTEEPQPGIDPDYLDDEIIEKLQALYMSTVIGCYEENDTNSDHAESSAWAAKRGSDKPTPMHRCAACREETEFSMLFERAMNDESLFPPRCCRQPFALNIVRIFLNSDLIKRSEKKKIEFETPNRTYCYSPECSAFIHRSNIEDDIATCPECSFTTCTSFKERAHTGDCPNDTALQQLLETAQQNDWQRCYSCWRFVELKHGCNHMICRCGAKFCYNCGERWRTGQCAEWDEHRLRARAYEIIDRDVNRPAAHAPADVAQAAPANQPEAAVEPVREPVNDAEEINAGITREQQVQRLTQELEENHEYFGLAGGAERTDCETRKTRIENGHVEQIWIGLWLPLMKLEYS
ncbi:BRcat and Rcat domain-containing protein [Aspergillus stella-maris]|uniref:BRcat and Rcat domain-containing protein n=1 Tax=Aspergillus stella-maris TaxID=1810926 RepID=UPI003CCD7EC0